MEPQAVEKPSTDLDALSIQQRARRHPRRRVMVTPLAWTQLQVKLLQCRFGEPRPAPPTAMKLPPTDDAGASSCDDYEGPRQQAWHALLGDSQGPLSTSPLLHFRLGGYCGVRLPCLTFCLRADIQRRGPPVAAYIDRHHITSIRKPRYCKRPGSTGIKIKRFEPKEPLHEPYLVALLIALAQEQWSILKLRMTPPVLGFKAKVLCTSNDGKDIHLYSADVSSVLLAMLRDPALAPTAPQSLHVDITAIASEPAGTLRGRVMAQLLSATSLEDVGNSEDLVVYK